MSAEQGPGGTRGPGRALARPASTDAGPDACAACPGPLQRRVDTRGEVVSRRRSCVLVIVPALTAEFRAVVSAAMIAAFNPAADLPAVASAIASSDLPAARSARSVVSLIPRYWAAAAVLAPSPRPRPPARNPPRPNPPRPNPPRAPRIGAAVLWLMRCSSEAACAWVRRPAVTAALIRSLSAALIAALSALGVTPSRLATSPR